MKNPKNNKQQKTNIKYITTERNENYKTFSLYHIKDKRLSCALVGFMDRLFALPKDFKITYKATSKYIGVSERTFQNYIRELKNLGYIELKKDKTNKAEYIIKERTIKVDFNPRYIKSYTLPQINYFLNSNDIEPRYKALIKKAFDTATKDTIEFDKTIKELEELEQEPTSTKDELEELNNELPF